MTAEPVEPAQRRRRRGRRRPRSVSFGGSHRYVVSYDNPVELKPMAVPRPKLTLEQAAMQSVTNRVANQPRLHVRRPRDEPQIVYTRGIYRPQPVYWRGTSDSQGFSFLHNSSQDSRIKDLDQTNEDDEDEDAEDSPGPGLDIEPLETSPQKPSETTFDANKSESTPGSDHGSAFVAVGPRAYSLRRQLRSLRRARKYVTAPARRERGPPERGPLISEPGPVDFSQYGMVAKMWMEQVDMKTVLKSKTMYLSVMPTGARLPDQLLKSLKYEATPDSEVQMAHWIMVRERSLGRLRQKQRSSQYLGVQDSVDLDLSSGPLSPSRRLMLFFQVGEKWKDLAWALFAGVHTDAETLRMITDVELKHPDDLSDQIQDMMSRWWQRQGNSATVAQLRDALDLIQVPYVEEDNVDARPSFSTSFAIDSDPEELDVGEVTENDPNVSRLMHTYRTQSLNRSYTRDGSPAHRQDMLRRDASTELLSSSDQTNLARGSSLPAVRNTEMKKNIHNTSFPTYSAADDRPPELSRGRMATEDLSRESYL